MPKPFAYKVGQVVMLRVTVTDDRDVGNPVVDLGGFQTSIPQVNLDKADVRPASAREKTDEERDRAAHEREMRDKQAASAKAVADKAAAEAKASADVLAVAAPPDDAADDIQAP